MVTACRSAAMYHPHPLFHIRRWNKASNYRCAQPASYRFTIHATTRRWAHVLDVKHIKRLGGLPGRSSHRFSAVAQHVRACSMSARAAGFKAYAILGCRVRAWETQFIAEVFVCCSGVVLGRCGLNVEAWVVFSSIGPWLDQQMRVVQLRPAKSWEDDATEALHFPGLKRAMWSNSEVKSLSGGHWFWDLPWP